MGSVGNAAFARETHSVDVCVVGAGMAGICTAIAAARHGATVMLMHDRPMPGGNASSECRVHVCGADVQNGNVHLRETGILEELRLNNLRCNPDRNISVWDTVLYEAVQFQSGLSQLLNCSCVDAVMDGTQVVSVTGWQLTTYTYHTVNAKVFVDCTGDAILAPLTGAAYRCGREARSEFDESLAPETADDLTMGMTCYFHAREYDSPRPFTAPSWAHRFDSCDDLPYGEKGHRVWQAGYWWAELGGTRDTIGESEALRDELLKVIYGVWDHIKNRCNHRDEAANWGLEWIQFLPAKRESRRYVGDHVLNQNDIDSEGRFDDIVAYGGWSMDDHHPEGINSVKLGAPSTIFHHAPAPYGIPYRSLYSKTIDNLMFAGRDASCTHMAMSSTRVQGTGCSMGQAVGTAAALAVRDSISPRDISSRIGELQQALLRDDCYIPWVPLVLGGLTTTARLSASQGDPEPLRDGTNRQVGDDPHCWTARKGDSVTYTWDDPVDISEVSLVLDSGMDKLIALSYVILRNQLSTFPPETVRGYTLEVREGGAWQTLAEPDDNHQRFVRHKIDRTVDGIRFTLRDTWGGEESRVYGMWVV